jgi:hypothetical protein
MVALLETLLTSEPDAFFLGIVGSMRALGRFCKVRNKGSRCKVQSVAVSGRYLWNTNRTSISRVVGPACQDTEYRSSAIAPNQNLAAPLVYTEARFFKFSKTSLDWTAAVRPVLSELRPCLMEARISSRRDSPVATTEQAHDSVGLSV